jgi:tRNA(Arg) A34 adenosine deaminase TadA|tara:strand:- start:159 stop:518 length:360 start_codon:yes stop_codon:yes gene_type:complete
MKQQFIVRAMEEAQRSDQNFKHGALLVKNRKIISQGHNRTTTKCPSHMFSIHAEIAAIKQFSEKINIQNSHIYVVRINNQSSLADSKPCYNCQHFMKLHGISRVFYSTGKENEFNNLYI